MANKLAKDKPFELFYIGCKGKFQWQSAITFIVLAFPFLALSIRVMPFAHFALSLNSVSIRELKRYTFNTTFFLEITHELNGL